MTKTVRAMAQALVVAHLLGEVDALPAYTTVVDYGDDAAVKAEGAGKSGISCGLYMRGVKGSGALSSYFAKDFFSTWDTAANLATAIATTNICLKKTATAAWCTGIITTAAGATTYNAGYGAHVEGVATGPALAPGLSINGVAACS
jgi:hypothetical protein